LAAAVCNYVLLVSSVFLIYNILTFDPKKKELSGLFLLAPVLCHMGFLCYDIALFVTATNSLDSSMSPFLKLVGFHCYNVVLVFQLFLVRMSCYCLGWGLIAGVAWLELELRDFQPGLRFRFVQTCRFSADCCDVGPLGADLGYYLLALSPVLSCCLQVFVVGSADCG
jgi:hypothetical protein